MKPIFVKATTHDKAEVAALFDDVRKDLEQKGNFMWSGDYPKLDYLYEDIDAGRMLLAKMDDKIVGCIAYNEDPLNYFYPDSLDETKYLSLLQKADLGKESKIIVLERLMVHPSYQGRGIATSIFSHLHETVPQYDWLFAVFLNDENAIRLYRHLGYKEIGIFPDFEWGGSANECTVFVKNYHL